MQTSIQFKSVPTARLWAGLIITGLVTLFLAFDGIAKVMQVAPVLKANEQLGLPANSVVPIGVLLLACTTIYAIPQTAILGAILLTGYLGGAVAIKIRAWDGIFPVTFTIGFGVLVWFGLVLREPRLVRLVVFRQW
jgi:hypothetical protein